MFSDLVDDVIGLSDGDVTERLREIEMERRRLDAETALLIAVTQQRSIHHIDGHRSIAEHLRAELNWSTHMASAYVSLARAVDRVPGLGATWFDGRFGFPQATKLARTHGNHRVRDRLGEFAPILLEHAEELAYSDFAETIDHFVQLADTDGAHLDRDENVEHRNARVLDVGGSLDVAANGGDPLIAAEMIEIFRRFCEHEFNLDCAARKERWPASPDENPLPRTAKQRRFDALIRLFRCAANSDGVITESQPLVNITVDIDTWTRILVDAELVTEHDLDGNAVDPITGLTDPDRLLRELVGEPEHLAQRRCSTSSGVQLHPHDVLRATLTGHVRRAVIDGESVTIDYGRKQRLFTGPARDAAKLLVRHCQHLGCELPVDLCEVDHMDEWVADDGTTDQSNADIQCPPHNLEKHRQRWRTKRATNGRTYTVRRDGSIMLPIGARTPTFAEPSA